LHYYSEDNARTTNGVLNISSTLKSNWYKAFDEEKKFFYSDQKFVQTGMVQSWNKFCFIGGIVEFRAKLPGDPKIGGLWPACEFLASPACLPHCRISHLARVKP
jgi:beta-glucanase (GH16 family)